MKFWHVLLLLLALGLGWCGRSVWLPSGKQPNVVYQPAHWETNDSLIVFAPNKIYRANATDIQKLTLLVDFPPEDFDRVFTVRFSCISDVKWRLNWQKHFSNGNISGGSTWEIDPAAMEVIPKDKISGGIIDPLDCGVHKKDLQTARSIYNSNEENGTNITYSENAFEKNDVAFSKTYNQDGQVFIETDARDEKTPIKLEKAPTSRLWDGYQTTKDIQTGKYLLLYGRYATQFSPDTWNNNLYVWILDVKTGENQAVHIPAGPWVKNNLDGSVSMTGCFSCGCGCYREMTFYLVNGRLFTHIWNFGFPGNLQGIYELTYLEAEPEWKLIAPGVIKSPLRFSPDGCRVALATPDISIKELCG